MRCGIRKYGLKAMVLLFAFVLGVSLTKMVREAGYIRCPAGSEAVHTSLDYASLQRVNYCALVTAPELYEGRVLLLTVKHPWPGIVRADELCLKGDPKFNMEFVGSSLSEADKEAFRRGAELTLAGSFSKSPAAGNSPKYQFQVFTVYVAQISVSQ